MTGRASSRSERALGWFVAVSLVVGCGGVTHLQADVVVPAHVPLRIYPRVLLVATADADTLLLSAALEEQVARDGLVRVERVEPVLLADLLAAGQVAPHTAVVELELELVEMTRERVTRRPETVCDSAGCYARERPASYFVPRVEGVLRFRVREAAGGPPLAEMALRAAAEARPPDSLRESVRAELTGLLLGLIEARVERERVVLLGVDGAPRDGVAEAIALARTGRWSAARRLLEELVERFSELPPQEHARLLHDLALARRFDPSTLASDPEAHFRAAMRPLRRAIALDPRGRYREALERLVAHRELVRQRAMQERAAEENHAMEASVPGAPPPPPAYQSPTP